jgi:hypothetical protein
MGRVARQLIGVLRHPEVITPNLITVGSKTGSDLVPGEKPAVMGFLIGIDSLF